VLFDQPDAQHQRRLRQHPIGALQQTVAGDGFDLGLAFDGDGDRVLAVDASGELVDAISSSPSRPASQGPGQAPQRHRGHHGDDEPRLPPRHAARGIEVLVPTSATATW